MEASNYCLICFSSIEIQNENKIEKSSRDFCNLNSINLFFTTKSLLDSKFNNDISEQKVPLNCLNCQTELSKGISVFYKIKALEEEFFSIKLKLKESLEKSLHLTSPDNNAWFKETRNFILNGLQLNSFPIVDHNHQLIITEAKQLFNKTEDNAFENLEGIDFDFDDPSPPSLSPINISSPLPLPPQIKIEAEDIISGDEKLDDDETDYEFEADGVKEQIESNSDQNDEDSDYVDESKINKRKRKSLDYLCSYCNNKFRTLGLLCKHLKLVHKGKRAFQCQKCSLSFINRTKLKMHQEKIHLIFTEKYERNRSSILFKKPEEEDSYPKTLRNKPGRKSNKSVFFGPVYKHQCRHCPEYFDGLMQLCKHLKQVHPGERAYECKEPDCNLSFLNRTKLKRHQIKKHLHLAKYKCEACLIGFDDKTRYEQHLVTHVNEYPFSCDICKREFKTESYFKKHKSLHSSSGVICEICGKEMISEQTLKGHLKNVHNKEEKERDQKCDQCDYATYSKGYLKNHKIQVHIAARNFVCEHCGSSFKIRYHLREHLRTHTGERPYKCEICSKTFAKRLAFKNHEVLHKDKNPWSCDLCPRTFPKKCLLRLHDRHYHNPETRSVKNCAVRTEKADWKSFVPTERGPYNF